MRIVARRDLVYVGLSPGAGLRGEDELCRTGEAMTLIPEAELSPALAASLKDVRRRTPARILPVLWRGRPRWVEVGDHVEVAEDAPSPLRGGTVRRPVRSG